MMRQSRSGGGSMLDSCHGTPIGGVIVIAPEWSDMNGPSAVDTIERVPIMSVS